MLIQILSANGNITNKTRASFSFQSREVFPGDGLGLARMLIKRPAIAGGALLATPRSCKQLPSGLRDLRAGELSQTRVQGGYRVAVVLDLIEHPMIQL